MKACDPNTASPNARQAPPPRRRLLRIGPAAEYISTSKWKLRELANNGQIPVVQPSDGSPFLFDVRDLDGWIERNKRTK
jgi:excisionase family DNA binding protein